MPIPRLVIAGTQSGVGKTTVTMAILAALKARGRQVQAFKVGPDFIDPGHHSAITGRPSRNLDGWMLGRDRNHEIFHRAALGADVCLIEGMMGLFDGSAATTEVGSTAELAKHVQAPVLLVMDGSAMARSAAAMASGYARFDPDLRVAGVVLNRIGGEGHYRLLKEAIEEGAGVPVVGYLKPDPAIEVPDRHLGLVTAIECGSGGLYARLAAAAGETLDLDRLEALARSAPELEPPLAPPSSFIHHGDGQRATRVGIAYDAAFCFYYPDNLALLEEHGAELIRFSPLRDPSLPDVDLVYLGGGYPEVHAAALTANEPMRRALYEFSQRGGPIYAECGGLMYLTEAIRDFDGYRHEMTGVFPAEAVMHKSRLTIGYREVEMTRPSILGEPGITIRGHEFHYSSLQFSTAPQYGAWLTDAGGRRRAEDGLIAGNTVALYTHLHFASQPSVARALIEAARAWTTREVEDSRSRT